VLRYAVVTPARNESGYIDHTLASMAGQTVPPERWVVVDDGSTDDTAELVQAYADKYSWIELIRLPAGRQRTFAAKVGAFDAGYARLEGLDLDVVANLDADISFDSDYFAFLLDKFAEDPRLGVAGTPFVEEGVQYDYRYTNVAHVSGACQLFRRECWNEIGGYVPIEGGGIDWVAVTTARMRGWTTRTFTERTCQHHRAMGTGARRGQLRALYRHGRKDHALGGHPLWQMFRAAYQMTRRPFLTGGGALLLGYASAWLTRAPRSVSDELMRFNQQEQLTRLRAALRLPGGK